MVGATVLQLLNNNYYELNSVFSDSYVDVLPISPCDST